MICVPVCSESPGSSSRSNDDTDSQARTGIQEGVRVEWGNWGGDGLNDCAGDDFLEPPEEIFLNGFVGAVWEEGLLGTR